MLDTAESLQLILGIDKRNPCFCLYTDADEKLLHVYYGLELLERVPNDRNHPTYRLLAARLYNAGLRVATLEAVFGLNRKTLRSWGLALRAGDREWLAQVLAGRWGRRKFTVEMESYVRARWPALRGQRDYRRRLRTELERVFGVKVSGETLRPVLRQLRDSNASGPASNEAVGAKAQGTEKPSGGPVASSGLAGPTEVGIAGPVAEPRDLPGLLALVAVAGPLPESAAETVVAVAAEPSSARVVERAVAALPPSVATLEVCPLLLPAPAAQTAVGSSEVGSLAPLTGPSTPAELAEVSGVSTRSAASVLPVSRQILPLLDDWSVGQTAWCEHAGLLWFWESLAGVSRVVEPDQPWLGQALGSVLAGALNVEQTKYLNPEDLDLLLGATVRGLGPQRQRLKELAAGATADALLRWNGQRVGAAGQSDFYFDPHTKHYTGMAAVLKGWCPTIRWADKALHSDFLHTVAGQPLYFECTDNYEDVRTRLWGVVDRARATLGWPLDKPITLVIDRAVFAQETFEKVLATPALHLVTWQKGYPSGGWDEAKVSGQCVIERPRNRAADLQSYQFRYIDQKWARDPRWRQLIVRATTPWGRTVEVAVLSDDLVRAAVELVRLMFGRWVQENDFKYLDQHFGINQITSYGVIDYAQLQGQLTDRQVENGAYRALVEEARQVRAQLGRLLWAQRQGEQGQAARQARLTELEQASAPAAPPADLTEASVAAAARRRERARLKAAQARGDTSRAARQKKIAQLEGQWTQLTGQAAQTQQSVSRLENLISRQMVRLDTGPKRLLDAIKVVARNEFYRALGPFRAAYDNYRDDHDHFRRLTQSAGVLRWNGQELEVHLLPSAPYGAVLRRVWEQVLAGVNAVGPVWPDGSGRRLRFRLASRPELQVSLRLL